MVRWAFRVLSCADPRVCGSGRAGHLAARFDLGGGLAGYAFNGGVSVRDSGFGLRRLSRCSVLPRGSLLRF
jgi:hypothetical protein